LLKRRRKVENTAALLREISGIVTPSEVVVEPDVNVVAAQLICEIESASCRFIFSWSRKRFDCLKLRSGLKIAAHVCR
jgi:hypothetical protein